MLPRIASLATVVPPHSLPLAETVRWAREVFGEGSPALGLVERCGVEQRHLSIPVEQVVQPRSLAQTSRLYKEHALALALRVVPAALARAGLVPDEIDHLITVSCTGVMIPSLDAELMNRLPFRRNCVRTPITELGCAAGAVGLSRAYDYTLAHSGSSVLLVAVELPSLTFQPGDTSVSNLIASSLFSDGAAAAVVTGRPGFGPTIVDARSELFPQTQHIMGFDLEDGGFRIRLDHELAPLLNREIEGVIERLLAPHRVTPRDLRFFALHPGGRRLLELMEERLAISREATRASWDVLREFGNMSSATVLFVLERLLKDPSPAPGAFGLLAAFGPGFSSETLLLQWT